MLSSVLAFLVATRGAGFSWPAVGILSAGGFLTTAAANILNEILEKEYDQQMARTKNRPLVTGRLSSSEALLMAGLCSIAGITLLALFNPWTAFLGMVSLISYAFVYTPLKRVGPIAVIVGAIPGALPALIGSAAAESQITLLGMTLFAIQFLWQLPHFYAIGFLGADDYRKAGFRLVPRRDGAVDSRTLGRGSVWACVGLFPLVLVPYFLGVTTGFATTFALIMTALFLRSAAKFAQHPERKTALGMMFFSFAYLPLVFLAYWLGQLTL